jgi:hypothetical protein
MESLSKDPGIVMQVWRKERISMALPPAKGSVSFLMTKAIHLGK